MTDPTNTIDKLTEIIKQSGAPKLVVKDLEQSILAWALAWALEAVSEKKTEETMTVYPKDYFGKPGKPYTEVSDFDKGYNQAIDDFRAKLTGGTE